MTNPFYTEIIRGAQTAAAAEAGYTMLLADAQESDQVEREALERALPTVEGMVLASSRMSDSAIRMIAKQRPTVVLNRAIPDVPCLVTDNARGVRRAVEHLAGLGHDAITYLGGPEASWADGTALAGVAGDRCRSWRCTRRRIGPYPPTVAGGERRGRQVAGARRRAVIAYNDLMAIGFIRWVRAQGCGCPSDVSVVGFDNIFAAELVSPALTTVAAPLRMMGETAVRNLLAIAHGARMRTGEPTVLPVKLVVRSSTGPRR